jgi:hypothetical protein
MPQGRFSLRGIGKPAGKFNPDNEDARRELYEKSVFERPPSAGEEAAKKSAYDNDLNYPYHVSPGEKLGQMLGVSGHSKEWDDKRMKEFGEKRAAISTTDAFGNYKHKYDPPEEEYIKKALRGKK